MRSRFASAASSSPLLRHGMHAFYPSPLEGEVRVGGVPPLGNCLRILTERLARFVCVPRRPLTLTFPSKGEGRKRTVDAATPACAGATRKKTARARRRLP